VDASFFHQLELGYPFNHDFLPYFGPSVHVFKDPFFLPAAFFTDHRDLTLGQWAL